MTEKLAKLVDVKSLVTLAMTGAMIGMLFGGITPDKELLMLFSTSYGAVVTYFFTRRKDGGVPRNSAKPPPAEGVHPLVGVGFVALSLGFIWGLLR